jgi:hypothetical protein
VLDQMNYDAPKDCKYGDQIEALFNARSTSYLSFIDDLVSAAKGLGGVPGYINMRFTRQTDAHVGMEQFPVTVGVEVVVNKPSDNGERLLEEASRAAAARGGIPHWGKNVFGTPRALAPFPDGSVDCFRLRDRPH